MTFDVTKLIAEELARLQTDLPIYRSQQRGGFQEPAFFISKMTSEIRPNLFGIQFRDEHYQLVYFPKPDCPDEDMAIMEEFLMANFNQLSTFAKVRNRRFERHDHTLQLTFEISFRAVPVDDGIRQQTMVYEGGLKRNGE